MRCSSERRRLEETSSEAEEVEMADTTALLIPASEGLEENDMESTDDIDKDMQLVSRVSLLSPEREVPELGLSLYWKFSTVMGFCDILIDIDKYFCYIYLIHVVGCDFQVHYGVLSFIYTITYLLWSPAAGLISDLLEKYILLSMAFFSACLSLTYGVILITTPRGSVLTCLYAVRCIFQIQLSSSTWKAIKMLVEGNLGSDPVLHEAAINKIGTLGDLSTGVLEVALVAGCLASGTFFENYRLLTGLLSGAVVSIAVIMFVLSVSLIFKYGPTLVDKAGEGLAQAERRDSITSIASNANDSREAVTGIWGYLSQRFKYFLGSVILTNCASLSMVSSCFEYMFDGPVTLTRATISKTQHGLCGGEVDFILMQAFMLQVMYLLGGTVYFSVIMKMHPATYYGRVFPATSVLFMLASVTPWLPVSEIAAAAVISAVTVVSYYMSIYNSYMLSGASRAEYFGFVQGLYSIAVGIAGLVPSVLQMMNASQGILMSVAFVMATWGLLQSIHLWSREFSSHAD